MFNCTYMPYFVLIQWTRVKAYQCVRLLPFIWFCCCSWVRKVFLGTKPQYRKSPLRETRRLALQPRPPKTNSAADTGDASTDSFAAAPRYAERTWVASWFSDCFSMQCDYPRVAKQHGLQQDTGDTNGRAVHHCITFSASQAIRHDDSLNQGPKT
jgi:hypothetical protein